MEQLAVSVEEAAQAIGLGRTKMYELVHSGQIRSFKVGRQRRIRVTDLHAWIAAQPPDVVPAPDMSTVMQMPNLLDTRPYTRKRRTES